MRMGTPTGMTPIDLSTTEDAGDMSEIFSLTKRVGHKGLSQLGHNLPDRWLVGDFLLPMSKGGCYWSFSGEHDKHGRAQ